jgi:hypothetical protein
VKELNDLMNDFDNTLKCNYSLVQKEKLTYDDMDKPELRAEIVAKVKEFNDFFFVLCEDIHVVDRFLVENKALLKFKELVNTDLEHHLINGWNFVNKNQEDKNGSDPIEDTIFFYPLIGSIRDNLIENLKED